MQKLVSYKKNICIGALYSGKACGAIIGELVYDELYIRYIFVDPLVRRKGCGRLLVLKTIALASKMNINNIKVIYSNDMIENYGSQKVFQSGGMSKERVFATGFSGQLGDIELPKHDTQNNIKIYNAPQLPHELEVDFYEKIDLGIFPSFTDIKKTLNLIQELCFYASIGEEVVGALITAEYYGGVLVQGLCVEENYNFTSVAYSLIKRVLEDGRKNYPNDTLIAISSISHEADKICRRLFVKALVEETEYMCEYHTKYNNQTI